MRLFLLACLQFSLCLIICSSSRNSVVGVVTALQVGVSGIRTTIGTKDLSLLQNVLSGPVAYPVSYSVGTEVLSFG